MSSTSSDFVSTTPPLGTPQSQSVMDFSDEDKLLAALESGNFQTALQLLPKDGPSPPTVGPDNLTPLHYACQHGRADIALLLITEYNYSINTRSRVGQTPLHFAAKYGQLLQLVVLLLLQQTSGKQSSEVGTHSKQPLLPKVSLTASDDDGNTLLHLAATHGHPHLTKYLIHDAHCNPAPTNNEKQTPLHLAAIHGHLEVVQYLVEKEGCDPSARDEYGRTPLYLAAGSGQLEVVKYLITEKQCDPNCRTTKCWKTKGWKFNPGRTPLHNASQGGHLDIVKYLVNNLGCDPSCKVDDGDTPLLVASYGGHLPVVHFFTEEKHCDLLCRNKDGDTPLHGAALGGSLEVVKFFINEKGCDPMCRGKCGTTPLHYASQEGHLEIAKYLIDEQHVDPSCLDEDNHTPLRLASQHGDPLHKNKHGNTPLHGAALGGHLEIVKFFISEKGCDPMCRGWSGRTPLHHASQKGHLEIVKFLIEEKQVKPSCPDNNNATPLHMASLCGHMFVVRYLVEHKHCDPELKTKFDKTPVDFAIERNHTDVVQYLISKGGTLSRYVLQKGVAISPLVKIHVVGNSGSGKSSLVKALQDEDSPNTGRLFNVSGVIPKTCGIIPVEFQSKNFGKVTLYDFAGHEEYYAGHETVFQNSSHAVVLLVVNLEDPPDKIGKALAYWESLITNAVSASKCHIDVIIVGSHTDHLSVQDLKTKTAILSESSSDNQNLEHVGLVTFDCRKSSSPGITQLRQLLQQRCEDVRIKDKSKCQNGAILNSFLTKQLPSMKACTFIELLSLVLDNQNSDFTLLKSPLLLQHSCESLNNSGHILFLKNKERPEESWLILNKEAILSDVHGLLKQVQLSRTSGIVSQFQLRAILKNARVGLHIDLVRRYLVQMEFCIEVESHLLELIGGSELLHIKENCFLFPDLLSENRPSDVWQPNPQFIYYFGWGLKCTKSSHFFTPRFLQVLLILLASRFALSPHPESPGLLEPAQGCRLWKNGIRWQDGWGIEVIVEISDQNTVLNVIMRCLKGSEMKLVQMCSSLIQHVLSAKGRICPTISPKEYLIHHSCLQRYPMEVVNELPVKHITEAIKNEHPYLQLDEHGSPSNYMSITELLYFEPYHNLGVELLQQLFDTRHGDKGIPHDILCGVATALQNQWKTLCEQYVSRGEIAKVEMNSTMNEAQKCLHILTIWSGKDGTYGSLRQFLDQYSVFAERNPLTLETPSPACPGGLTPLMMAV